MELRFDAILYSELGNEHYDAGHIKCSRGRHLARKLQVPHPWMMTQVDPSKPIAIIEHFKTCSEQSAGGSIFHF